MFSDNFKIEQYLITKHYGRWTNHCNLCKTAFQNNNCVLHATWGSILERSRMSAAYVTKHFWIRVIHATQGLTLEKNLINAAYATWNFLIITVLLAIWGFTLKRNHIGASYVKRHFRLIVILATCRSILERSRMSAAYVTCHTRIHTGEKPYQCSLCDMEFSNNNCLTLTRHMRIHTEEKQYRCSICKTAFPNNCHTCHMWIRTGESRMSASYVTQHFWILVTQGFILEKNLINAAYMRHAMF